MSTYAPARDFYAKALLAPYQRPQEIHFVRRFAHTPTVKIQHRTILEQLIDNRSTRPCPLMSHP